MVAEQRRDLVRDLGEVRAEQRAVVGEQGDLPSSAARATAAIESGHGVMPLRRFAIHCSTVMSKSSAFTNAAW